MKQRKRAPVFLRDGTVYVFNFAHVPKWPDIVGDCVAKHPESINPAELGRDVLRALEGYGRPMTEDERKVHPDPVRSVMGYANNRKFNEGLGSVGISLSTEPNPYSIVAWRTEGLDSFPMEESKITLPAGASAAEIGEAVLKLLKHSREHNSTSRAENVKAKKPARRASKK